MFILNVSCKLKSNISVINFLFLFNVTQSPASLDVRDWRRFFTPASIRTQGQREHGAVTDGGQQEALW